MDPRIGWDMPEQRGPALTLWSRVQYLAAPKLLSPQPPNPYSSQSSSRLGGALTASTGTSDYSNKGSGSTSRSDTPLTDGGAAGGGGSASGAGAMRSGANSPKSLPSIGLNSTATVAENNNGAIFKSLDFIPLSTSESASTTKAPGSDTPDSSISGSVTRRGTDFNRASTYDFNQNAKALTGKYGGTPWLKPGKKYYGCIGLHEEMLDFFDWIKPNEHEKAVRQRVFDRIRHCILTLYPHAQVDYFGSFRTLLFLPTSDIDMVVVGKWDFLPLRTIESALKEAGIVDDDGIKVLDRASVPIIKLTDKETDIRVDISFNIRTGVLSAELIQQYLEEFPALRYIVYVLKQYLLQRDLNEVFIGGVSSYSLILMTVSYLQLHNSLDTRIAVGPQLDPPDEKQNLGVFLLEFFELYGRHFNYYKTAIRVKDGGRYVPKTEMLKEMTDGHRPSMLCIEDPLQPGNDIGRSSFGVMEVKRAFEWAYLVLSEAVLGTMTSRHLVQEGSLLSRVIRITDEVVDYRKWLCDTIDVSPQLSLAPPMPPPSQDVADDKSIDNRSLPDAGDAIVENGCADSSVSLDADVTLDITQDGDLSNISSDSDQEDCAKATAPSIIVNGMPGAVSVTTVSVTTPSALHPDAPPSMPLYSAVVAKHSPPQSTGLPSKLSPGNSARESSEESEFSEDENQSDSDVSSQSAETASRLSYSSVAAKGHMGTKKGSEPLFAPLGAASELPPQHRRRHWHRANSSQSMPVVKTATAPTTSSPNANTTAKVSREPRHASGASPAGRSAAASTSFVLRADSRGSVASADTVLATRAGNGATAHARFYEKKRPHHGHGAHAGRQSGGYYGHYHHQGRAYQGRQTSSSGASNTSERSRGPQKGAGISPRKQSRKTQSVEDFAQPSAPLLHHNPPGHQSGHLPPSVPPGTRGGDASQNAPTAKHRTRYRQTNRRGSRSLKDDY